MARRTEGENNNNCKTIKCRVVGGVKVSLSVTHHSSLLSVGVHKNSDLFQGYPPILHKYGTIY